MPFGTIGRGAVTETTECIFCYKGNCFILEYVLFMEIFRVGGAVRDKLLGLPGKDQDWVVVGATPQMMKGLGFKPVGQDFPVFLHPQTQEEYALARTERKSGHGYAGFTFHASSDITLEEDLQRRDLTINAMAEDEAGNIVDPYGGQQDLKNRLLRHVSLAFQEDPLRILRVARFAARLSPMGFTIADETMALMRHMVSSGEAAYLVAERVWQETHRALCEPAPEIYFQTLENCGALKVVMAPLQHFINQRTLGYLIRSAQDQSPPLVRFGCLFIPAASGEIQSLQHIRALSATLRLPVEYTDIATVVVNNAHKYITLMQKPDGETAVALFEALDALRRPERFDVFVKVVGYGFAHNQNLALNWLHECLSIKARDVVSENIRGKAVGVALRAARVAHLDQLLVNS